MTRQRYEYTAGGDGFVSLEEWRIEELRTAATTKQLAKASLDLCRVVNRINAIVERMPEGVLTLIGDDLRRAAERINDLGGECGVAADRNNGYL